VLSQQHFSEEASEAFRKECQVLKSIVGHPNLLLFMGACMEEGRCKIVLEWARNGSLESVISDGSQKMSFRRKIILLQEICSAMTWLHKREEKILHLNLKPSNILLSSSWAVKVTDYGLGHVQNFSDPKRIENKAAYYTAPELLSGSEPMEFCDVYSFGVLTWYILTEKDPFDIKDMSKFKNHVTSGNRPSIPANTPQVLKDMMERCWGKVPTQRPKFEELIIENNWSKIITDAVTHGQEEAEGVWKNFGKKGEIPKTVPWLEFVRGFSKFLEVPNKTAPDLDKTIEWKCLGAILEVNVDKTMPNVVTHESFVRFLSWFGPVRTGPTEGVAFLKQFVNLLQQEWFHGNIDEKEAEKRLVSDSRKKEALFLLRFSTSIFTYSMTFKKKIER